MAVFIFAMHSSEEYRPLHDGSDYGDHGEKYRHTGFLESLGRPLRLSYWIVAAQTLAIILLLADRFWSPNLRQDPTRCDMLYCTYH